MAEDIRRNEVVPERRRADEAEAGLSELRRSAHEWLATAHAVKLEAVTQALADGYLHGCGDGRAEAEADALRLELSLRTELDELRSDFALHRARSRETALTLTMAVSDATRETSEMVSAAAKAGASALMASQDVWKAEGLAEGYARGRAEGFVAGRLEGFSAGHAEGVKMDRSAAAAAAAKAEAAADDFTSRRVQVTEMGGKTAGDQAAIEGEVGDTMATATVAAMAPADDAERDLREAFAAYVVSAHDQKLSFARKEKFAAEEKARGLGEELAAARSVLAEVLQVRVCLCGVYRTLLTLAMYLMSPPWSGPCGIQWYLYLSSVAHLYKTSSLRLQLLGKKCGEIRKRRFTNWWRVEPVDLPVARFSCFLRVTYLHENRCDRREEEERGGVLCNALASSRKCRMKFCRRFQHLTRIVAVVVMVTRVSRILHFADLQERISEIEARHNLVESHNLSAEAQHSQSTALLKSPAWLDAAASVAEQRLSSAFWQECGGAQQ